ncbi:MAG TPA: hypothetical protein VKU00_06905 [Chthonomonadaceae bacterium]|nr:hypothetical protein [Chthonomonadaceae bacterium]
MAAICIDTIEGVVDDTLFFHFDLSNDVLYIRRNSTRNQTVYGEETTEGFTLLRTEDDEVAGLTIVNYWQRFGAGEVQKVTLQDLQQRVEQWTQVHALAA